MDTDKYLEKTYLTTDAIKNSATKKCVILNEGTEEQTKFGTPRISLLIELDNKQKKWSPNNDTLSNLRNEFGKDSKHWVGKVVMLSVSTKNNKDIIMGFPLPLGSTFENLN